MKILYNFFYRFQYLIIVTFTALLIISLGLVTQLITTKINNNMTATNKPISTPPLEIAKNNTNYSSLNTPFSPKISQNNPLSSPVLQTPHIKLFKPNNTTKINEDINLYQDKSTSNLPQLSLPPNRIKQNFNHFSYSENISKNLIKVANYYNRSEFLDYEAAEAFKRMKLDAKNNGIDLVIISGFRSISDQEKLFKKQIERRGSKKEAAKLSAPPGFSEHHTGFAMDIGDGKMPNNDLKISFETTPAYLWLIQNAYHYGFELSFPLNNSQGVSFEPWHWRFVVSERANQVFYEARKYRYS